MLASDIERIHVIINPGSSIFKTEAGEALVRSQLDDLRDSEFSSRVPQSWDDLIEIDFDQRRMAAIYDDIIETPHDVVATIGGDGTHFADTNTCVKYCESDIAKNSARLLLAGGFANDGPFQLNSKRMLQRPSGILRQGNIVEFHPQLWSFTDEDGQDIDYANFYGSLNGSAAGAEVLDMPWARDFTKNSHIRKAALTWLVVANMPRLQVLDQAGVERAVQELIIANGSHMAGFPDCFPIKVNDPLMFRCETAVRQPLREAIRFQRKDVKGEKITGPFELKVLDDTVVELDGQAKRITKNTDVVVSQSSETVRAYSTSL